MFLINSLTHYAKGTSFFDCIYYFFHVLFTPLGSFHLSLTVLFSIPLLVFFPFDGGPPFFFAFFYLRGFSLFLWFFGFCCFFGFRGFIRHYFPFLCWFLFQLLRCFCLLVSVSFWFPFSICFFHCFTLKTYPYLGRVNM